MKAYISVSYHQRKLLGPALYEITVTLHSFNIVPFIFVDNYHFSAIQEKEMMQQAMNDIEKCDLLIAEASDKAIGIGIEAGYAKAKGRPVIYIRQKEAEHSTTLSGISDYSILYTDTIDLVKQFTIILQKIISVPG
jgi:2'-deoxynucleoside 5'-phosphate N-hydrolase